MPKVSYCKIQVSYFKILSVSIGIWSPWGSTKVFLLGLLIFELNVFLYSISVHRRRNLVKWWWRWNILLYIWWVFFPTYDTDRLIDFIQNNVPNGSLITKSPIWHYYEIHVWLRNFVKYLFSTRYVYYDLWINSMLCWKL